MVDQPATDDEANERRCERLFDRRYRLLELREQRLDRKAKYAELEINRQLRLSEIQATEGRGVRFTSSQATVAAAVIALLSAVFGATIQGFVTRNVEADKNAALIAVEKLKAEGSLGCRAA
jgi:hypothetical protein